MLLLLSSAGLAASSPHLHLRRDGTAGFGSQGGPMQNVVQNSPTGYAQWGPTVTRISDTETTTETWSPSCLGKLSSLIGSFCVPPTTEEMDADPDKLLPRLTFSLDRLKDAPPVTLFLFDDEDNSYAAFWHAVLKNQTCDSVKKVAKATMTEGPSGKITGFKNLKGKLPHLWYMVAMECDSRTCPAVVSANITFFHPNSDGTVDSCRQMEAGSKALKSAFLEGWKAMSVRNVLKVVGISPFGVFVLYVGFCVMLVSSLLFLIWGVKAESSRRFMYFNTFFVTAISAMAYLAMATGTGIQVLRRMDSESGEAGTWSVSDPMMVWPGTAAHPNPLYDENYAHSKTYPIFYARYFMLILAQPLILLDLFLVTGVGFSTRSFMWFCNTMMLLCWLAGAFVTGASRWGFWVFGTAFSLGVFIPMVGVLPTAAARKGRASRRLYGRLMCVTLIGLVISPWIWVLVDGSHALPSDLAVLVFVCVDFMSQCVFGTMLLRNAPSIADWGDEEAQPDAKTQSAEQLGDQL